MKSKIFSSDFVKTTSRGQIWIPILLGLGFLLAFPVAGLIQLGNWTAFEYTRDQIGLLYENLWRDGYMLTGYVVICAGAVINGINGFWYLYSSRKIDFYHSLPVSRRNMFWHKIYTGVLYYLIPYVIMEFLAICMGTMRGFFNLKLMGMALSMLAFHLLLYLLVYFSTVLVICVTGNILMGFLCLFGFFCYNVFLTWLLSSYRAIFYFTSYVVKDYGLLKFIRLYASAPALGQSLVDARGNGDYSGLLVIVMIVTAALGFLAYLAYIKRPAESVGRPMIYGWVAVLVKFLVVVPSGMGIGLIFFLLPESSAKGIWWIFGLVLGTVLSHGMMEVLYQMDFRKFFSARLQFAAAAVLVLLCTCCYKMDLFGYDAYLPAQEKVAGLYIDLDGCYQNGISYVSADEAGEYRTDVSWDSEEMSVIGENGMGNRTYGVLKKIVESQREYYGFGKITTFRGAILALRSIGSNYDESSGAFNIVSMKFVSTAGREIYRNYRMTGEQLRELQAALYEEGNYRDVLYSAVGIEPEYLTDVEGVFADGSGYALFQDDAGKQRELFDAFREDVKEASSTELLGQPIAGLQFVYRLPAGSDQELYMMIPGEKERIFRSCYFYVYPAFKRTIAILKETGYPLSMEEITLASVRVNSFSGSGEYTAESEITYDDPGQLEELKKCIVTGFLQSPTVEYKWNADVFFQIEGEKGETFGSLRTDDLPDFIEEQLE